MNRLLSLLLLGISPALGAQENAALKQRLASGDGRAGLELAKQGAKAVPTLIAVMKEGDAKARGHAAYALGTIGPAAKDAVVELARAVEDEEPSLPGQAAHALGRIGPASGPALLEILQKGDAKTSVHAARALAKIQPPVQGAAGPLLAALKKEQSPREQTAFIDALAAQGPDAALAVPLLVDLASRDKGPQTHAVIALGRIGSGAKDAVPFLIDVLRKKDAGPITLHAVESLGQIGVRSPDIATVLLDLMKEGNQPRMVLLESLSKAGGVTKDNLAAVSQGMRDKDQVVRLYSARLVGSIDPNDQSVVSVVIEALGDKDAKVRKVAAEVLQTVQPRDEAVFEALANAGRDTDPDVRKAAALALEKFRKR